MLDLRGRTALVTGASAGIGREIARVLAPKVGTLILVARRRERLDELAAELVAARPTLRVLVRACDLVDRAATGTLLDDLARAGEHVDVLVNNAGFGDRGLFDRREWPKLERMLELNVVSATYLLHRLVPEMVRRGSGGVLNVGSTAGIVPTPSSATYGATKAYLNHLTEGLRAELAGTGVVVTALLPGPVETEFQAVAGGEGSRLPRLFFVDARDCAEQAVRALEAGKPRVIPGLPMRLAALSVEAMPKVLMRPLLRRGALRVRQRGRDPSSQGAAEGAAETAVKRLRLRKRSA